MVFRRSMTSLAIAAALVTALAVPAPARAADAKEMLKFVPQDAWGFVMLQSMDTIDEKATQLQKLGAPIPFPQVTPMILQTLAITPQDNPIDMKSPVGVVMLDMNKYGGGDYQKSIVALIPAKDGKALVTKLGGGEPEDGIITCKTPMGQDVYAVIHDSYVVLSQGQDAVKAASKPAQAMSDDVVDARGKLLATSDFYVSISVRTLVAAHKDMILSFMQMASAGAGGDAKSMEQLVQMFLEMESFDLALRLDEMGLFLRALSIPKKGSDLEKLMLDTKNSESSLLAVLPKEQYLFAMGGTGGYSEHASKFGDQNIVSTLVKSAQVPGLDESAVKKIDEELQKMIKNLGAWAMSVSGLPEGANGLFGAAIVVESSNPGEFVSSLRSIYETVWQVSDDEDVEQLKQSVVHAKDAETIDDQKVDTITVKLDGLAELAAMDPDDLKKAQTVFGKEIVFRFGVASDKHVVFSFGGGKERHQTIMKSVKSRSGASLSTDAGITDVSKLLPSPRSGEGYVAVDNLLRTVKGVLKATGEDDDIPAVPDINAPVAFGTAQIGSVQRMDFYVPMKVIEAVKKMINESMQAEMNAFDEEDEDADTESEDEGSDEGMDEE